MGTPIIKGASAPFRGPVEIDDSNGNTWRVTVEWHGPYTALKAIKPAVGSTLVGFSTDLLVKSAVVKRDEGTYGTLTVILECTVTPNTIGFTREILEVSQMLVERPILDHPVLTAGETPMADDLARWRDCPDPDLKLHWYYLDAAGDEQQLTDTEIIWAKKILRGVETFKDFVPVIRRRRAYNGAPTTSACGTIDTPPLSVDGVDSYLKTADDATEDDNGNWTRVEEWTGASGEWDPDIYGPSSRASRSKQAKASRRRSK